MAELQRLGGTLALLHHVPVGGRAPGTQSGCCTVEVDCLLGVDLGVSFGTVHPVALVLLGRVGVVEPS